MFEILKPAKVSITDFAKIAGVSRVAVSQWVNGRMNPHRLHQAKIKLIINAMENAVAAKELPLPAGLDRLSAFRRMKQVVLQHVVEIKNKKDNGAE